MACRTIGIGMSERFKRIVWVAESWAKNKISMKGSGTRKEKERDIRYVDSQDLLYDLDFDEEIKGTCTRVS
jgi:hypothetical protein